MSRGIRFVSGINEGHCIPLREGQEVILGRNKKNDVVLSADSWVSGTHAAVKLQGGRLYLKDLRSTNGTFVASERIPPDSYRRIEDLFVVGSTIFEATTNAINRRETPLPLDNRFLAETASPDLVRTARKLAGSSPVISSIHLFLALMNLYEADLAPFFSALELELSAERIQVRYQKQKLFRGREAWLNRFLALSDKGTSGKIVYLTPLVQEVLATDAKPRQRLAHLLENGYNLVYPVLHHEKTKSRWFEVIDKLAAPSEKVVTAEIDPSVPAYLAPLLRMDDFWHHLAETLTSGATAIVTGDFGCGKSAILSLGLHKKVRTGLPKALTGARAYFDPKTFFQLPNQLMVADYLAGIRASIDKPELTVIDHLDVLTDALEERELRPDQILTAIARSRFPLIVVASRNTTMSRAAALGDHQVLDLNHYLGNVIGTCQNALLNGFSEGLEVAVDEGTRKFFKSKVVGSDRYNLRAQKEYIDLCTNRFRQIDLSLARIGDETVSMGGMGTAIFREVFDQWMDRPRAETPLEELTQHFELSEMPADAEQVEAATVDHIEDLIHNFAKHVFKVSLSYSDRTTSLNAKGRLSRIEKLAELQEHVVFLISAFQSAFPAWFEELWMKLDPEMIREDLGRPAGAKKLWTEYETRSRNIDTAYAEDLFHQTAAKFFLEALRSKK